MRPSPVLEVEERRLRRAMLLELTVMANQIEADGVDAGWRLLRAEVRGLPVRQGAPSIPRLQRRSDGGAPAARLLRRRWLWFPSGLCCNFAFLVGCLVRFLV
jgi:hypothetical protein